MSFSHSGDFEKILSNMNIKISQDKGQARTTPIPRNSLDKGAFFLQGGACHQRRPCCEILLDNGGNPGRIVTGRGARRPDPNLINPVAQAFQPVLAQANVP
jgi:hypothetical protein